MIFVLGGKKAGKKLNISVVRGIKYMSGYGNSKDMVHG
jgi:hypothetical protein